MDARPKRARFSPYRNRPYVIQIRTDAAERDALESAAKLSGEPLSTWARAALRRVAARELREAGLGVPFLLEKKPPSESTNVDGIGGSDGV